MSRTLCFALFATILASAPAWADESIVCKDAQKKLVLSIEGEQAKITLAGKQETIAIVDITDPHELTYTEYKAADNARDFHFFDADGGGFTVTYNGAEYHPDCTYAGN